MSAAVAGQSAPLVSSLGYVGVTAVDLAAWETFGTNVLGLQVSESTTGRLLLRADERAWRVSVRPGDGSAEFIGWEVDEPAKLASLVTALEGVGADVLRDPVLAKERGVAELVRVTDPAGIQLEFFYGPELPETPFTSPNGATFVTGGLGLGHVVLVVPDMQAAEHFYLDVLGFLESDRVRTPRFDVLFTHCNPRHHSLAMMPSKSGLEVGLHHFMMEVDDLDTVGHALDRVLDGAAQLNSSIGKHINDLMVSFYCQTPSKCEVEYGVGGITIDDATWQPTVHTIENVWGHRRMPGAPPDGM
ncbi:VOC family protein [Cryptosporangium sp. NPDC051539]|uniref:VOC family protein n=1 Tax=Cryptosporangium sp. NPDC051539 TaxID=3363962 RepID=UPI00379580C2